MGHAVTMGVPYFTFRYNLVFGDGFAHASGDTAYEKVMARMSEGLLRNYSYQEAQSKLPDYSLSDEVWERVDVIVELGYVLCFGFAAPETFLLFLVSNLIRMRAIGWVVRNA